MMQKGCETAEPYFFRRHGWLLRPDRSHNQLPRREVERAINIRQLLQNLWHATQRVAQPRRSVAAPDAPALAPLRKLIVADDVGRTLFGEYASHRQSERGHEETGWTLLGVRRGDEALVLATLPAGSQRDADEDHVQFDAAVQAFAGRLVRQEHRQLRLIGVVHTHPGSLRHPSAADYRGDLEWVPQLYGGEGVFGIGTADATPTPDGVAWQPAPHVECLGPLCFSWYVLGAADRNYRPLPMELTIGPDLAAPWRTVWGEVEAHATRLEALAQALQRVRFAVQPGEHKPALVMMLPLPGAGDRELQIRMEGQGVRYFLLTRDGPLAANFHEQRVDVGVFTMLAELAA